MPQRQSRLCRDRLCKALHRNANGYCDAHQEMAQQIRNSKAGKYSSWYTTTAWRALRARQLTEQPICAYCEREGKVSAATVCDHITPHRGNEQLFWSGPFQSLCASCHNSTKQREEATHRAGRNRRA